MIDREKTVESAWTRVEPNIHLEILWKYKVVFDFASRIANGYCGFWVSVVVEIRIRNGIRKWDERSKEIFIPSNPFQGRRRV